MHLVIIMKLRIRDIREDRDLTQKQIADYLMCDQSLYSKYEREEREIPLHLIVRLARYYRVSVDYLVGLTNTKTPYPGERD
jgi:Predicted transcriptional regulators